MFDLRLALQTARMLENWLHTIKVEFLLSNFGCDSASGQACDSFSDTSGTTVHKAVALYNTQCILSLLTTNRCSLVDFL